MELFVQKRFSSKTNKEYVALFIKTPYSEQMLTIDKSVIVEVADVRMSELASLPVGEKIIVGIVEC